MKILMFSLHFIEYAFELAQALSKENRVHLILSEPKLPEEIRRALAEDSGGNLSYTLLGRYNWKHPGMYKNIFIVLKVALGFRPQIIHHQESGDFSNLAAFICAVFIPTVGTVHDVEPHLETANKQSPRLMVIRNFIRKRLYRKIIVHGRALKEHLIKITGRRPDDVAVIPHGCLFSFKSTSLHNKVREEEHTVLFFGRIGEYKGLRYLIATEPLVSRKIPDFKVIIAGRGEDLEANREKIEHNPHFEIHNRYIPNQEVALFFNRCALVLLPYIEASQSGVLAMAFAFGKPVIVTDVGSLSEVVKNGETGFIVPAKDNEKLAGAIVNLLQHKEMRKTMGKNTLKMARTDLSWEHIARLTQKVYQTALST